MADGFAYAAIAPDRAWRQTTLWAHARGLPVAWVGVPWLALVQGLSEAAWRAYFAGPEGVRTLGVDLRYPIILAPDGVTVLDGFHRIALARCQGVDNLPTVTLPGLPASDPEAVAAWTVECAGVGA